MKHVQAAVLWAPNTPMTHETLDLGPLRADEILVRLVATGICHTDISVMKRPFQVPQPIVLGHEGAGIVEAVGAGVTQVRPGDSVVMSYNSCGHCASCLDHAPTYCHDFQATNFLGQRADGTTALSRQGQPVRHAFFGQSSFASHSVCTERNVVKVPADLPLEVLGPLGCGIQTGAGAVINVLKPGFGQSLAVFGAGSVGMAAIMAARTLGVGTVIAIDLVEQRLALARELGATHVIDPGQTPDVPARIREITGAGVDFSLDTTAVMKVLRQAVDSLAPRGMCGFVGGAAVGSELALDVRDVMSKGKTVRGIVEGDANPQVFFPAMIEMYRQGRFPFDKLIRFYPFDRLNEAIADSESGRVVKPVVRMQA